MVGYLGVALNITTRRMEMTPFILLILVSEVYAGGHSLQYYRTAVSSPGYGLPAIFILGYVDDQEIESYNSDIHQYLPKVEWMKKVEPEYWERETKHHQSIEQAFQDHFQSVIERFKKTEGLHIYQEMYGCELRDDGSTAVYNKHGYNGRDFMYLDTKNWNWMPVMYEAQFSTEAWNRQERTLAEEWRIFLMNTCIERLKKIFSYGREDLENKGHNYFWYGGKFYSQKRGVAMGAKFAPSIANLFMGEWEDKKIFSVKRQELLIYRRYIDDLIFIWAGTRSSLTDFLAELNNNTSHINLTSEISAENINFLDVNIHRHGERLETKAYFKPTDANSYLPMQSGHHPAWLKNIPKGQVTRIRRNCSNDNDFYSQANIIKEKFLEKGYCDKQLDKVIEGVASTSRVCPEVKVWSRHLSDDVTRLHCLVYGFHPRPVDVKWVRNGKDDVPRDEMTPILPHPDGTYQIKVSVEVPTKDTYSCNVNHSSLGDETLSVIWDSSAKSKNNISVIVGICVAIAVKVITAVAIGVMACRNRPFDKIYTVQY
ncbi:uncharacterized protein LOC143987733 [Lithobates pipiens]